MKPKRLPDAEFELMDFIWDQEPPVTTARAHECIGKKNGVKMQTVVTLIGRLTERGFLRFERGKGREREFYPIISREEYLQMETEIFVGHYHKHSYGSLLSALHREKLTEKDLEELSQWIKDARRRYEYAGVSAHDDRVHGHDVGSGAAAFARLPAGDQAL